MFPDLVSKIRENVQRRIKRLPQHCNRASSIGGSCERELTYDRTAWEQADLPDVELQMIFEEGELHERQVLRELQDAGWQVIEQQASLEWREYQITGHVDAIVVADGQAMPLDVKSMSPHIWDAVAFRGQGCYDWEEVKEAFRSKPWLRKYLGQITIYCLLKNVDRGMLLCKNKGTGGLAQVNISLDYEYGEALLKRAERINRHIKDGTLPDRIPWDEETCGRCKFLSICLPERVGKNPLVFLEDSTIEALIEERAKLEESGKEFDRIDKRFKDWAKARPESTISIGHWLVTKTGGPSRTVVKVEPI